MEDLIKNRWLHFGLFLVFLLTLFYGTDFMSIWEVELPLALSSLDGLSEFEWISLYDNISPLAKIMSMGGLSTVGLNEWGIRIPSLIILSSSLFFFYKNGSIVLGKSPVFNTILLAIGAFPIILIGKLATADIWLFALQLTIFPLAIMQSKKYAYWRTAVLVLLGVLMFLVHPLSAIIFHAVFYGIMGIMHTKGRSLIPEMGLSLALMLALKFMIGINLHQEGFLCNYQRQLFFFITFTFFGTLGVMGFVPAVFAHWFRRLRAKEELAIISLAAFLGGLFSISFFGHFILLFLAVKQIENIDHPQYPYTGLLKVGLIFQVTVSFFIAMMFMVNGFNWYGGSGFRKAFYFGTPIWGFGIFVLVALYTKNKEHVLLGVILTGLVSNFLFWTQVLPVWEAERNLYKDIAIESKEVSPELDNKFLYITPKLSQNDALHFYRRTILKDEITGYAGYSTRDSIENTVYVMQKDSTGIQAGFKELKSIKGRAFPWDEMKEFVFVRKE